MSLLRKERLETKLAGYAVGAANAVTDPTLITKAQEYKRATASQLRAIDGEEVKKKFGPGDYHVSFKIDGEFSVLVYADGEAFHVNPGGTVRVGLACQKEAAEKLKAAGVKRALIAGELYYHKANGVRGRVYDVTRIARQPASKAELDDLRFGPFDIIELDGAPYKFTGIRDLWAKLEQFFHDGTRVILPETHWLKDGGEIAKQFKTWIKSGAEGVVVRSEGGSYKVKPRHNLDCVVIGFTESPEDDRHGMIHDLLLAVMRPDGMFQVLGHVGGGFTEDERRAFYADLKDDVVASEYVEVNDQVAYHMVLPETILEISVLDLLAQKTQGSVTTMVLNYDSAAKQYKIVRRMPLVKLISPQFVRRRDDKQVNATDLRIKQITDLVEVPDTERDAGGASLRPSAVLKREVYTKVLKGATMVRKFVLWETNKRADTDDFPAYVIHFTDFSPNRKTPLERDIRVSNSREQIDALWADLLAENIAKGWAPHVAGTTASPTPEESTSVSKPAPKKRAVPKKKADD